MDIEQALHIAKYESQNEVTNLLVHEVEILQEQLTQAESALWRICPNTYTISCKVNNFVKPDPFEGPGETYHDAYLRVKENNIQIQARVVELEKALREIVDKDTQIIIGDAGKNRSTIGKLGVMALKVLNNNLRVVK